MRRGGTFTEILMAVGRGGGGGGLKGFTYISIHFYGEPSDEGMIEKILALQTRTQCQNFFSSLFSGIARVTDSAGSATTPSLFFYSSILLFFYSSILLFFYSSILLFLHRIIPARLQSHSIVVVHLARRLVLDRLPVLRQPLSLGRHRRRLAHRDRQWRFLRDPPTDPSSLRQSKSKSKSLTTLAILSPLSPPRPAALSRHQRPVPVR